MVNGMRSVVVDKVASVTQACGLSNEVRIATDNIPSEEGVVVAGVPQCGQNRALVPNSVPHCPHKRVALNGGGTPPAFGGAAAACGCGAGRAIAVPQLGQNLASALACWPHWPQGKNVVAIGSLLIVVSVRISPNLQATRVPHSRQNFAPSWNAAPHCGQAVFRCSSRPHS